MALGSFWSCAERMTQKKSITNNKKTKTKTTRKRAKKKAHGKNKYKNFEG
jgi:hypothetical protein